MASTTSGNAGVEMKVAALSPEHLVPDPEDKAPPDQDTTTSGASHIHRKPSDLATKPKTELFDMREKIIQEQAAEGQEPGLSLVKDREGENKQETWGMVDDDTYDKGSAQESFVSDNV